MRLILLDDIKRILKIMGKLFDIYFCKACRLQHFPGLFSAPHPAQPGAVSSQRDRHTVHNGKGVEQGAHRVIDVFVNVAGCRNIMKINPRSSNSTGLRTDFEFGSQTAVNL